MRPTRSVRQSRSGGLHSADASELDQNETMPGRNLQPFARQRRSPLVMNTPRTAHSRTAGSMASLHRNNAEPPMSQNGTERALAQCVIARQVMRVENAVHVAQAMPGDRGDLGLGTSDKRKPGDGGRGAELSPPNSLTASSSRDTRRHPAETRWSGRERPRLLDPSSSSPVPEQSRIRRYWTGSRARRAANASCGS